MTKKIMFHIFKENDINALEIFITNGSLSLWFSTGCHKQEILCPTLAYRNWIHPYYFLKYNFYHFATVICSHVDPFGFILISKTFPLLPRVFYSMLMLMLCLNAWLPLHWEVYSTSQMLNIFLLPLPKRLCCW